MFQKHFQVLQRKEFCRLKSRFRISISFLFPLSLRLFHLGNNGTQNWDPVKKEGFQNVRCVPVFFSAQTNSSGIAFAAIRVENYILSVENWIDDRAPLVFCIFGAISCDKWSHAISLPFGPSAPISIFLFFWPRERGKKGNFSGTQAANLLFKRGDQIKSLNPQKSLRKSRWGEEWKLHFTFPVNVRENVSAVIFL